MTRSHSIAATAAFALALLVPPAHAADVHVGINVGVPPPPAFVFESPPPLVVVPGVPHVQYAPGVSVNFFSYGDRYYTYDNGAWFVAHGHRGPWSYVERGAVPAPILHVPYRYYHVAPRAVGGSRWRHDRGHGHSKHWNHDRGYDRHGKHNGKHKHH